MSDVSVSDSFTLRDAHESDFRQTSFSYDYSASPINVRVPNLFIEIAYKVPKVKIPNIFIEVAYKGTLGEWQIYEV